MQEKRFLKILESHWKKFIIYPLFKLIFSNPEINTPVSIHLLKKILILRYDRIGDMIVTTPFFKILKQINPSMKIGVVASPLNVEIIRNNPHIDTIYVLHSKWIEYFKEIRIIRNEKYDVVLNMVFNRMTGSGLLSNIVSPTGIKIGQGNEKYRFFYNYYVSIQRDSRHMVDLLAYYLEKTLSIDIQAFKKEYEIIIDDEIQDRVRKYLLKNKILSNMASTTSHIPYIVFNLSASDQWTRFSKVQVKEVCSFLDSLKSFKTILIYAPTDYEMKETAEKICSKTGCLLFPENGKASLLEIAALIGSARCVISPDTSTIHFASAMNTPVLGFYTSAKEKQEWLPYNIKYRIVMSENNRPTSAVSIPTMINAIDVFIREITAEHG